MFRLSIHIAAILIALLPVISLAENWVALGDSPINGELELDSVKKQGKTGLASIRIVTSEDGATYAMHQSLAIYCGTFQMEILSGHISSNQSSKIVQMPPMPKSERAIHLPSQNSGYNRLYEYICQQ